MDISKKEWEKLIGEIRMNNKILLNKSRTVSIPVRVENDNDWEFVPIKDSYGYHMAVF